MAETTCNLTSLTAEPRSRNGKVFTGTGLKKSDPAKYEFVLAALKERNVSYEAIARIFSVSPNTIRAIAKDHQIEPCDRRSNLLGKVDKAIDTSIDQLQQALDAREIKPGQLAVTTGILLDKRSDLLIEGQMQAAQIEGEPAVADILGELRGLAGPKTQVLIQVNTIQSSHYETTGH
jgi:hypothetical protein